LKLTRLQKYGQKFFNLKTKDTLINTNEFLKPIVKLVPDKIDENSANGFIDLKGNYYKCGFEGHKWLAKELFISKTIDLTTEERKTGTTYATDYDRILEQRGWVKLSDYRIRRFNLIEKPITSYQKDAIENFALMSGKTNFELNGHIVSYTKLIEEIS
jgi:hypothetical protein